MKTILAAALIAAFATPALAFKADDMPNWTVEEINQLKTRCEAFYDDKNDADCNTLEGLYWYFLTSGNEPQKAGE